ncbi:cytochrome P450 [Roridomyces roridus]|uniref:Cytochrome P450 n=1 Tax=Roridomyces roridus TaxID=1738132 RepID=A0AAD7FFP3_9AGAR|nr:cytochrome P450 [Roridomyces roridus]
MSSLLPISLGVLFLFLCVRILRIGSRERGLPPGPPTVPILGNMHIFPTEYAHYKFTEWARKYGGFYSLKMGSGTVVVLTDPAAVKYLMDQRSGNTVDRPPAYIADSVTGGLSLVMARYTETWRTLRRAAHSILTPQQSQKHLPIQKAEATQLLHDILTKPEGFYKHLRRYASSVILSVLYGKRAPRYETPETTAFFESQHEWESIIDPGATPPVDFFPILKYVPERWAKWKRDCAKTRKMQRDLYFGLLDETKERVARGEDNGSYMEEILRNQEELGMDREMAGYLGGILIEGGSDTTSAFLQTLVLALTAYPDAQRKAQEEMDRVVGSQRLPTLEDLDHLPYTRALILETHRFRPVAPTLMVHATLAADEYKGYVIPKGATIFVNAYGIFHDPELFEDPETFQPRRYLLTENGTKPGVDGSDLRHSFAFGVGRRICPGIHLATNSININTMNLIWAFQFSPETDESGNPIPPDTSAYLRGVISAPGPFKCTITPRSKERADIIENELFEATDTFRKFEYGLSAEDKEFVAKSRA